MSLKAEKGLKQRSREQCKAQTKAGGVCQPCCEDPDVTSFVESNARGVSIDGDVVPSME